jgi:hypothetical protein
MADIPILGQTSSADGPLHTDDLTDEQRAALAKLADANPPGEDETHTKVTTAFLIVVGADGAVIADADLTRSAELVLERGATPDDIYGAAAVVQKDLAAMETAQRTQQAMMMMGQAMQQQAQEAALRKRLQL